MNSEANESTLSYEIPIEALAAIGTMTLAAAALEKQMQQVAHAVCVKTPEKMQPTSIKRAVRKEIHDRNGTPPWSTVSDSQVHTWLDSATEALNERHKFIHSFTYFKMGNPVLVAQHIKSGETRPFTEDAINGVVEKLRAATTMGRQVHFGLLVELRTGVYLDFYPSAHGTAETFVVYTDGRYPDRPSPEEIATFWEANEHLVQAGPDYPRNPPAFPK